MKSMTRRSRVRSSKRRAKGYAVRQLRRQTNAITAYRCKSMKARKTLMIQPDVHKSLKLAALHRDLQVEVLADQLLREGLKLEPAKMQKKSTPRSRKK